MNLKKIIFKGLCYGSLFLGLNKSQFYQQQIFQSKENNFDIRKQCIQQLKGLKVVYISKNLDKQLLQLILQIAKFYELQVYYTDEEDKILSVQNGDIFYDKIDDDFALFKFLAFLQKIKFIKNKEEMKYIFQNLNQVQDFSIFVTYIPNEEDYKKQFEQYSSFQQYELSYQKDLQKIQDNFQLFKNNYIPLNTRFVIIKDKTCAENLNISEKNIGELYLLEQPTELNDFNKNLRLNDKLFNIEKIGSSVLEIDHLNVTQQYKKYYLKRLQKVSKQIDINKLYLNAFYLQLKDFLFVKLDNKQHSKQIKKVRDLNDFAIKNNLIRVIAMDKDILEQTVSQKGKHCNTR